MGKRTALLPALLLLASPAAAQERPKQAPPAEVERVYVPSKGFQKVLRRHPRGVLITEAELAKLLKLAGRTPPAVVSTAPPPPLAATIQRLTVSGKVEQNVAVLTADARVSVLAPGQVGLPLPLSGVGLRGVWVDGKPARVIVTARGPEVLLAGGAAASRPVDRRVTWELALTVQPGEGRGAGGLGIPVPACAAGRLRLDLPGDLEVRSRVGTLGARPGERFVAWGTPAEGRTLAEGAFGGGNRRGGQALLLAWRPRRAIERVTPYVTAATRSTFFVDASHVALSSTIDLDVYRAGRDAFTLELPGGFVVTKLTFAQGGVTHRQRGDRVEVRLDTRRKGRLQLHLAAELSLSGGKRATTQTLSLRPVAFPDVDRVSGTVRIARSATTQLRFGRVTNLVRADAATTRGAAPVRVYRRGSQRGALTVTATPLEPKVRLELNTTVQVREREVRAIALYRFQVEQGSVFTLRASLPPGYGLEDTLLSRDGRTVTHQLKRRASEGGTELVVELDRALTRGQQVLFAVEAVREHPQGLAGRDLPLPRFGGGPATRLTGHLGLAPDGAFRLRGSDLRGLTAIPAQELRRRGSRGIEWADVVLAYRIEKPSFSGTVAVTKKDSRLTAEVLAHHTVGDQTVATDAVLDLEIRGAPRRELVLLFPPGVGKLARIDGPGVQPDREPLGANDDGWERFKLGFERPVEGKLRLRVRFETRLATESGTTQHRLPKVSVEGSVRERGALAVFSAGASEVRETPEGLRSLDVTDLPTHPFRPRPDQRPLLAFTHVSHDYALTLAITRHARTPILTAVAESLTLRSSVGPDGTARHTARFRVKNLANQYFAISLPEDAVLWSVVVDGEGVKPAGEGGERIIPIPTVGAKGPNDFTQVAVTYTSQGSRWGTFGSSDLVAPQLRFGKTTGSVTDVVPVLRTRWELALPDDYRVLEFDGNVDGKPVPSVRALALAGWQSAKRGPWTWLLALCVFGLGVGASTRLRRGLLVGLVGARGVARDAKDAASDAAGDPAVRKGALVLVGAAALVGLGVFAVSFILGGRAGAPASMEVARTADRGKSVGSTLAQEKKARRNMKHGADGVEAGGSGGASAPDALRQVTPQRRSRFQRGGKKGKGKSKAIDRRRPVRSRGRRSRKAKKNKEEAKRFSGREGRDHAPADKAAEEPEPQDALPPPAPKPTKPMPNQPAATPEFTKSKDSKKRAAPEKKPSADDEDDAMPDADMPTPKSDPAPSGLKGPTGGVRGGGGGERFDRGKNDTTSPDTGKQRPGEDAPGLVTEIEEGVVLGKVTNEKVKFGALGGFGQVGLRSLVLDLAAVGKRAEFARAGGQALLSVHYVKEALMITVGGCLALLGFLLGLLLPRTGRLTAAGLLAVALVALTAVPVLWPGSAVTALLNALALGLLLAAPAVALIALGRWWSTAPLSRLARAMAEVSEERERTSTGGGGAAAVAVLSLVLIGAPDAAHAKGEAVKPEPLRVYVPYDTRDTDRSGRPVGRGTVFLPQKVFQELKRRAGQAPRKTAEPPLPAQHIVTGVDYQGELSDGGLSLSATVKVDVLAKGWQRVHLGLAGTGLKRSQVRGAAAEEARVKVAPAGGYELVARGPAVYTVVLDLIVPRRTGKYTFATVPCLAARMAIATPNLGDRRLVVDGAAAQLERPHQGKQTVFASLGDARSVSLLLRSKAVLSSGASEASAQTVSIVSVLPGRVGLFSQTSFVISGAGREGFVFALPEGFQATRVVVVDPRTRQELPMRGWSTAKDRLEITLRRPTGARAVVEVHGEQRIDPTAKTLSAPQLTAQGVSRETGQVGLVTSKRLKVRPGKARGLRQIPTGPLQGVADQLKLGQVQWAYRFARRPARLAIELVREAVELQASSKITAVVKKDRYLVGADFLFQVRRGQLYELRLAVPAGLELQRPLRGELAVSEITHVDGPEGWRTYTLGLKSALTGGADLGLDFERRLVPGEVARGVSLPFPEVRPLNVSREQSSVGLATGDNLELRVPQDPSGLVLRDVNEVTRGWSRPSGRARWQLGYTRPARQGGIDGPPAAVKVKRPTPYVEGSWVLHARVERDVVRYTLRALYQISRAGVDTFRLLVPKGIERQARVDAKNRREVEVSAAGDRLRYTVHLQSPVETFYGLSITWEELLGDEREIKIPAVGVDGIDRAVRGFVLVEKASSVADRLQETGLTGAARKGRAGDAPALPPGKGAQDFVLAYQVPLSKGADWGITCKLERRNVQLPAAARIPWAHITSVFTRDGRVRHRARYRVRNLRLQFLELALPAKAEVWSVFVAGKPRRLHHKDGHALIPLPKRSAADLAFDVTLIYTTELSGSLGFGGLRVAAPVLQTPEIQVEKTFWTAYLPDDLEYRGFGGNVKRTTELEVQVTTLVEEVQEQARLEELARSGAGNKRVVADNNIDSQRARVQEQLRMCEAIDTTKLPKEDKKKVEELLGLLRKQNQAAQQLERASSQRRRAYAAQQKQQQRRGRLGEVQQVGGNKFVRLDQRSWNRNTSFFKKGNKERWAYTTQRGSGQGKVVLVLPEGGRLSLGNMELLDGSRNRILNSSGYTSRLKEAKQAGAATGKYWQARRRAEEQERTRGADGLLSIKVDFPTPGRAFHFVTDTAEAPTLEVSSYPKETASVAARVAQALVLLALLAAILRLGLHLPIAGKGALQSLLLIIAVALAAFSLASLIGAAITFLLSLAGIHHGRLWSELADAAAPAVAEATT